MYFIEFYYNDKHFYFGFEENIPVAASSKKMCLDILRYEIKQLSLADVNRMKALLNTLNDNDICYTDTHVFKGLFNMLKNPCTQGFTGVDLDYDSEDILVTINLDEHLIYNEDFEESIIC
jgi:hypothetical protein